jgi:hypothetical protein
MFDHTPNPDLKKNRSKQRKMKIARIYIYFSMALLPLLALVVIGNSSQVPVPQQSTDAPRGIAVATTAAVEWAANQPTTEILGWSGFEFGSTLPEQETTIENHSFAVSVNGAPFVLVVTVAVSPTGSSWVPTPPTMFPIDKGVQSDVPSSWRWPTASTTSARSSWTESANSWVRAYLSGEQQRLLEIVRDPNPDNKYVPLVGFQLDGTPIISAVGLRTDGLALLGVQFKMVGPDGVAVPVEFDLLLDDINSAAPSVKAWGTPGSGELLVPYQNAVTSSRTVTAPASTTTTTTTTPPTEPPPTEPPPTEPPPTEPPPTEPPPTEPPPPEPPPVEQEQQPGPAEPEEELVG